MIQSNNLQRKSICLSILILAAAAHRYPSLAYRISPIQRSALAFTDAESIILTKRGGAELPEKMSEERRLLEEEFLQRRWKTLMENGIGNWSGSIGWYDVVPTSTETNKGREFVARADNNQLNMRFSFQRRADNPDNLADWIVYHARERGSKDHVVIEKGSAVDPNHPQTLYCFEDGILGRTGKKVTLGFVHPDQRIFMSIPVVEHGFWDHDDKRGMRRTVVVTYDPDTLQLSKICFLQLEKRPQDEDFDVSAFDQDDIKVLATAEKSKSGILSLQERQAILADWGVIRMERCARVDGLGLKLEHKSEQDSGALDRLFGNGDNSDEMVRMSLPNGVVVACPNILPDTLGEVDANTSDLPFYISLGYKRRCGQAQIVEIYYNRSTGMMDFAQASYYSCSKKDE